MDPSSPPLLETSSLVLAGERPLVAGSLVITGPKVALWDESGRLLPAMIHKEQIESGGIQLLGREPALSLSSGKAAYIPTSLPLPSTVKVLEALSLSARLLGLSKSDARRALSRCRLATLESKKLGELTRLQMRLICIAHGIIGGPLVLLLENVFAELDEPETTIVEAILDVELEGKSYIMACGSGDPGARTIALGCDQALSTAGNELLPPQAPRLETASGYWVSCSGDVGPMADLLKTRGAEIARSPRNSVLLVRSAPGAAILRAAQETGLSVLELTPTGLGRASA